MKTLLAYDTTSASPGAWAHLQFKRSAIETSSTSTTAADLSGSSSTWARSLLGAVRQLGDSDLLYLRLSPRTIPLLLVARLARRPIAAELNGYVFRDWSAPAWLKGAAAALTRIALSGRGTHFVGDIAYREYARSLGSAPFHPVPLVSREGDVVASRHGARWRDDIVFAGSSAPWQGIDRLLRVAEQTDLWGWDLRLVGDHEPTVFHRSTIEPPCFGDDFARTLNAAGVLVAPNAADRGDGMRISTLKSLSYLATDRPVVLSARETALDALREAGPLESLGVFVDDGTDDASLRGALQAARAAAVAGASYPDRAALLAAAHSPTAVAETMERLLSKIEAGEPTRSSRG